MANTNKLIVMVAVMIFAVIGIVVTQLLNQFLIQAAGNSTGLVHDILVIITKQGLLEGILWLLISIICYIGVGKVIETGERVQPISIFFLIIWLGAVVGILIGIILYQLIQGQAANLTLDTLINSLLLYLAYALGPSFATALGISNRGPAK
jgi:hypothetical protein